MGISVDVLSWGWYVDVSVDVLGESGIAGGGKLYAELLPPEGQANGIKVPLLLLNSLYRETLSPLLQSSSP